MRMILGLDRPTSGHALVNGRRFTTFTEPLREVGALLDAGSLHPGRTGRHHLRVAARTNGIPERRVEEVDLDGVRWIRELLRRLADEGRTVLVSSHLMSEMQQTADRLVVIGRGRLIADETTQDILRGLGHLQVRVRSSQPDALFTRLQERGVSVHRVEADELLVEDGTAEDVGDLAHSLSIPLHHLSEVRQSLEQAYIELTSNAVEYHGRQAERVRTPREEEQ